MSLYYHQNLGVLDTIASHLSTIATKIVLLEDICDKLDTLIYNVGNIDTNTAQCSEDVRSCVYGIGSEGWNVANTP